MKLAGMVLVALLPCVAATPEINKSKALGTPNAPLTMEIFSDYTCPHCRVLHEEILPLFMKDFVVPGKMYVVMREFPLTGPGHQYSREAATYAVAAARIGKYEEVADALFKNQATWAINGKVWDTVAAALPNPADQKNLKDKMKDPGVASEVQRELDEGMAAGVTSTPTMIVTHKGRRYPLNGIETSNYDLIKRFIDDLASR